MIAACRAPRRPAALTLVMALLHSAPALAQQQDARGVSAGVETTRDRFHYRFENPSSFGTVELVPHEFTQTYWADNQWVALRARFGPSGRVFQSEIAVSRRRATRGDDYDTFFQATGDVVVTGTTGDVVMQSWRARQTIGLGRNGCPFLRSSSTRRRPASISARTVVRARAASTLAA